jgi:hypothetical protein
MLQSSIKIVLSEILFIIISSIWHRDCRFLKSSCIPIMGTEGGRHESKSDSCFGALNGHVKPA